MSTTPDMPLSGLLEKANYIKKAMGNLEEEITNKAFLVRKNGIQVTMRGTHILENIIVDPERQHEPMNQIIPLIQEAVNTAVRDIEAKRHEAFKHISANIHDENDGPLHDDTST